MLWSGGAVAARAAGKMPVAVMADSAFSFRKLLDQCENQELEVARQSGAGGWAPFPGQRARPRPAGRRSTPPPPPPIHHAAVPDRSRETLLCNVKIKSSLTRLGAVPKESHGANVRRRQEDYTGELEASLGYVKSKQQQQKKIGKKASPTKRDGSSMLMRP